MAHALYILASGLHLGAIQRDLTQLPRARLQRSVQRLHHIDLAGAQEPAQAPAVGRAASAKAATDTASRRPPTDEIEQLVIIRTASIVRSVPAFGLPATDNGHQSAIKYAHRTTSPKRSTENNRTLCFTTFVRLQDSSRTCYEPAGAEAITQARKISLAAASGV
jgi:hypothetical protein